MVTGRDRSFETAGADSRLLHSCQSVPGLHEPATHWRPPTFTGAFSEPTVASQLRTRCASCARDGSTKLMSSAARTPGVIPHSGLVVPNSNKYVSLYVLLAGIIGGLLLILSLFLFCKYCRGKSQGTEGVGVPTGDSWVLREASFSLERPEDEDSIRDREETTVRRGSWGTERSKYGSESPPRQADASRGVLEEVSRNVPSSSRLVDDHGKTNIFLHRQKSFQKNDASSPITCFVKPTSEAVECEVAVEIHPGPSIKTSTTKTGPPPLLRHASVTSLCSNKGWECTEEGEADQQGSWRASSTDWTKLETSLDYWRQEHFKAQREDLTSTSKVRYNDTGSLEEVSVDNCVDYFVEDEIMVHLEAEREHMRQQYRRLWQLRATLEEDENPNVKQHSQEATAQPAAPAPAPAPATAPAHSSPDQSPEAEVPGSHTTSFDSNTEPLLEEGSTRLPPHLLQLPSYETRRQNYRNILNWRLRKMEARNARRHCGRQTSLEDTSFDSMDTVDTEESSTDASRIDQATTSFESTTDNTDSPSEQQVHRLQQLRADSGYRSLENPAPNTLKLLYPQQHVTSSEDPHTLSHRIPSVGESFENVSEAEEGISVIDIDIEGCSSQRTSEDLDEGVAGLRSPPTSIYESPPWEGRRKPGGQPTSKKRRDLSGSTPTVTATSTVRAEYARDYSVDEKSDALFREFSRCDLDSKRQHRLTAYRRLRGPYPYPKLSEPPSDELVLASVPIIRVAPEEESSDQV